jgi:5-methylthioadenosine/S-adenosylhomocysteine deaminase
MHYDIVIHGGTVVSVNADFEIIADGLICIKDRRLARVEARADSAPLPRADKIVDAKGMIILPGLVNAHTHMPMTLFRGLADDLPLQQWLQEHIFPAEATHINSKSVQLGTDLACAEMILSGTTTCCDGYFLEGDVAAAVNRCGMRAVLGHGVIDFPAPGLPDPAQNITTAVKFAEKWLETSPLIKPSIFCHSPYTCSAKTLQAAKKAADEYSLLFQIHVAETRNERNLIQSDLVASPVQYLDHLEIIDAHTLLVHGVWLDEADIDIIAQRGAAVAHNPESNMKLAAGIAPLPEGTDGCASNNNLDLFQTMDTAAKLHKVRKLDPTTVAAESVLGMATLGGARAIGLDREIGSLEVGKKADLIILNARQPHLVPLYHPVSHIVYSARGSDVTTVIIDGRFVLEDRRMLTINLDEVLENTIELTKTFATKDANR